jgi:hypothetical protein
VLAVNTASAHATDIELPALGDASSAVVSPYAERKLGEAWLRMFRSQVRTVSDPLLSDYLEHLVFDLAEHSQLSDAQLKLVVVENQTINAFAVPGGVMGIPTACCSTPGTDTASDAGPPQPAPLRAGVEARANAVPEPRSRWGASSSPLLLGITATGRHPAQQLRFSRALAERTASGC